MSKIKIKKIAIGTSLAVHWINMHTSNAGDAGSVPGWGVKVLHAVRHGQNIKNEDK